jgi:hypothetical protein
MAFFPGHVGTSDEIAETPYTRTGLECADEVAFALRSAAIPSMHQ